MGDKPFLGLETWIPAVRWIRACTANSVRLDLIAGVSLAAFVIPESLAYASLAQLPPVTGLYCYLVAGIAYALFGTSRQLAVGPTSALAIVIATSVAAMGDGDAGRAVALASALALIVGIVSVAGRFIGLANVAYFISDAVLVGFKTGAALYIASTQLPKLFGIEGVSGDFFSASLMSFCICRRPTFPPSSSALPPSRCSCCSSGPFRGGQQRWWSSLPPSEQ